MSTSVSRILCRITGIWTRSRRAVASSAPKSRGTIGLFLLTSVLVGASPATFIFRLPESGGNPFQRELWAEISTPTKRLLRVPVFYFGEGRFAARVNGSEVGSYRIGTISEAHAEGDFILQPEMVTPAVLENQVASMLPIVRRNAQDPRRFALSNGQPFTPLGANLAWPDATGLAFYDRAFSEFHGAGLNWARVWMASWSGLNLDWISAKQGPSLEIGRLDLGVAEKWDHLIETAERNEVYLQLVLQHHGQYSTGANPNWPENPWNVANLGGFLPTPEEFFVSPQARALTKWKLRYIVARWGWSPAIMAWELFNEVHFTDAIKLARDEASVAAWHSEMATYIRSLDTQRHLVTTSFERLRSPIYTALDYYQPHLYAANMLANPRVFEVPPEKLGAPVFYGEVGDDNVDLSAEQKSAGVALTPLVWSSLFSTGGYPAQLWLGWDVLKGGRLGELAVLSRFLRQSKLAERTDLVPFSPGIETSERVPLTVPGGQSWQREESPRIVLPLDGSMPLELAKVPRIFAGAPRNLKEGYPDRATFVVTYGKPATVHLRAADASPAGAKLRVLLDGVSTAEFTWPAPFRPATPDTAENSALPVRLPPLPPRPIVLTFSVTAGTHTFVIENPGGLDWWEFNQLDFGLDAPALAAIGKRGADILALWVWHRTNIFAVTPGSPAQGTLLLDDVAPGRWRIRWWNTKTGEGKIGNGPSQLLDHPGGRLRLPAPAISRDAAVLLQKETETTPVPSP